MTSPLPKELEPVANHILFQFLDETDRSRKGAFRSTTEWGFDLGVNHQDTTKSPRWVKIIGLGPDVPNDFHIGQVVLVAPLMWTQLVNYEGVEFARTDGSNVLAVDDDT